VLSEKSENNQMHLQVEKVLHWMLEEKEKEKEKGEECREWLIENGWVEFMTTEITMGTKNGARGVIIRIANQLFKGDQDSREVEMGNEWNLFK
jgi:hypothetical protein